LLLADGVGLQAQRLPVRAYTTADGLLHNSVNRIVKDSRGLLWFCTSDGLSRFDGYAFVNFGIEQGVPAAVFDLLETRDGEYWVASGAGLFRFDLAGRFSSAVLDDSNRRSPALTVLLEGHDKTIWSGTRAGLYRLETSEAQRVLRRIEIGMPDTPAASIIADLLEDSRHSLWIAATSGLYRRWPDGSTARYTERDGLPGSNVSDLLEDRDGHLWAATLAGGFFRFSADDSHRAPTVDRRFSHTDGLPSDWVFQLFETSDHRFWVANALGLSELLPDGRERGGRFRTYDKRNGLPRQIATLVEDRGGNLWTGSRAAGASKLARGGFATYGEPEGIASVSAVFDDQSGNVCFRGQVPGRADRSVREVLGADPVVDIARLGCFDGQRFDSFRPNTVTEAGWEEGLATPQATVQTANGEWWVGTGEGLYRYPAAPRLASLRSSRPLAVYTPADGLATSQVFRLFADSRGSVWVSTTSSTTTGLARWDAGDGHLIDLAGSPGLTSLPDRLARAFGEDRSGNVWIAFSDGLARYGQGRFTLFTRSDGLPGPVAGIFVDRSGRLWLASGQAGLVRVDGENLEHPKFVSYGTVQGLSSNRADVITDDAQGYLYVGGGSGLDRFDPATGDVRHFTSADGLPTGVFMAAFRDRTGALWFGMTSGLARLVPAPTTPSGPPPILISSVRVAGALWPISAAGERSVTLPDLAPGQNALQIDFVGLGFGTGDVLRYRYRLDGSRDDWSAPGVQRSVTYANLAPGRYRFVVRAMTSDGTASAEPAAITFTILSPLWRRWWFVSLGALALGAIAFGLHRVRLARLLEIANVRTRIASDLHDDIGANLTRIAFLTETARGTPEPGQGDGPLASIASIARESVSSMGDIVWAVNPARDTLLDLTLRMRQHADEVFTQRGVELHFHAPDAGDGVRVGADVRRDLLLIFKEVVNNAARHARCGRVAIELRLERSGLMLAISDDGVGFDTSVAGAGQGLVSIRRRAKRMNGMLAIASGHGNGTSVVLTLPPLSR
jgi:ligand-binding sensor domain-containing protein/signal transduction histidine kinase